MKIALTTSEEKISNLNDEVKRHGDNFTRQITHAIKKESWGWIAVELAWTAGITVIIAIYIAYYVGYGKSPETAVIFYFGTYTAIAILMAVIVRMVRNTSTNKEMKNNQRILLKCNNHIFNLMSKSRDSAMKEMEYMQRRIYAASIVLRDPEASSDDLAVAVRDLTGDKELSYAIKRIETFRHHGMMARIKDEYENISEVISAHHQSLLDVSPYTAKLFELRFSGEAPTMLNGHERPDGFLERTLNAIEHNDISLMAFNDVYDIFSFTFEMLNDREITVLHPEFTGHADYMSAQEKLNKSRSLLKQAVAKRNSRLKALADILNNLSNSDVIIPTRFNSEDIVPLIDDYYKEIKTIIKRAIKEDDKKTLRHYHKELKTSFKLCSKVARHQKRAERYMSAFNSIRKIFNRAWSKHGKSIRLLLEDDKNDKAGISIKEDIITLDDKQKMQLAKKLILLHKYTLEEQAKHYEKFTSIEFTTTAYKRMAMEYVMIMDEMLQFSQPEELFAIEYSHSPCFGHIDINAPVRTKVGLALLSIEELQQTRQKVAHRLARNLREYYRVPLNKKTVKYLVKNYGADKEYLAKLNKTSLAAKSDVEERYHIDLKLTDWEKGFAPTMKNMRAAIAKKA